MSAIYLTEQDVRELVDMESAVEAVEGAFRALADATAEDVPRQRARATGVMLHSMSAAATYLGLVGWKSYTTTRTAARFLVALYETSGELAALIEADHLGCLRTGAATGVAARALAPEVEAAGLFGAGHQARTQLAALAQVLPLRRATVYARTAATRERFAAQQSAELGFEVRAAARPEEAARELPLVVTITNSREPVVEPAWIADDALVCAAGSNAIGRSELGAELVGRAKHVVCDTLRSCRNEAGELVAAADAGAFRWDDAIELGPIVRGTTAAPTSGLRIFKSVGLAIEDVALGAVVLERARRTGRGTALPF